MVHLKILNVDESTYQAILKAINTRAGQIEGDITNELEALFEIRQSMGPNPESNSGGDIRVHFEKVDPEDAKKVLKNGPEDGERNLDTTCETKLQQLGEYITV